jgi:hypothetical protein
MVYFTRYIFLIFETASPDPRDRSDGKTNISLKVVKHISPKLYFLLFFFAGEISLPLRERRKNRPSNFPSQISQYLLYLNPDYALGSVMRVQKVRKSSV